MGTDTDPDRPRVKAGLEAGLPEPGDAAEKAGHGHDWACRQAGRNRLGEPAPETVCADRGCQADYLEDLAERKCSER